MVVVVVVAGVAVVILEKFDVVPLAMQNPVKQEKIEVALKVASPRLENEPPIGLDSLGQLTMVHVICGAQVALAVQVLRPEPVKPALHVMMRC